MLPSVAKSGWIAAGFLDHGPFGIALLAPERLFGLTGLDNLTHSLFWSLLVNVALYVGLSLARAPSAREASQALLFVDVFRRGGAEPVFWRGRARLDDLRGLAGRFLGPARAERALRRARPRDRRRPSPTSSPTPASSTASSGRSPAPSAPPRRASWSNPSPRRSRSSVDDVLEILDEASQLRGYARALRGEVASLAATAPRRQRAAAEPRPPQGRLHVLGHPRAPHAAHLDPRPLRAHARHPRHGARCSARSSCGSSSPRASA